MAGATTRLALPYPVPDDTTDVPRDVKALAEKLDQVVAIPDPGDLKFSARTAEHGAWVKADGRTLAAGVYPALRAALIADGSLYGADAGNPKLPDLRTRVPVGAGAGYSHGASGGAATHTLTPGEIPAHAHPFAATNYATAAGDFARAQTPDGSGIATSLGTQNAGGGGAHNNMQPYAVGTWFIYAGG